MGVTVARSAGRGYCTDHCGYRLYNHGWSWAFDQQVPARFEAEGLPDVAVPAPWTWLCGSAATS